VEDKIIAMSSLGWTFLAVMWTLIVTFSVWSVRLVLRQPLSGDNDTEAPEKRQVP
jgi:hypothetical protein